MVPLTLHFIMLPENTWAYWAIVWSINSTFW